ncbi:MAG: CDP-diacylglycerol---serine O-phosphatidyltransferase [Eubacteriales bacterium]|nr:CDP-diacylglycerol---serine O-phosphatidyltransferase [Eubacteriales bacterium]
MISRVLPSVVTLVNLIFGVVSLVETMNGNYPMAALMVLFGMVMDGMDGRIARKLAATSPFGKELDSLADLVSFGVAPALLVFAYRTSDLWLLGLVVSLGFTLCGAVRLARFNILNIRGYFVGVPITAAGSLVALMVLLDIFLKERVPTFVFFVLLVLLSLLMVSKIKVPKY